MDADFSHDPSALVEMADLLETNDVVLGSRYVKGGSVDERWPLWRKSLSAFGNYYARTILGLPLHDVTTGYRMWRRETLQQIPFERIQSSGYVFLVEMAYLAHCLEFKIGESPIYFADRRWGKSKMSIKIQAEAAFRIWQVWWHYRDLRKRERLGDCSVLLTSRFPDLGSVICFHYLGISLSGRITVNVQPLPCFAFQFDLAVHNGSQFCDNG